MQFLRHRRAVQEFRQMGAHVLRGWRPEVVCFEVARQVGDPHVGPCVRTAHPYRDDVVDGRRQRAGCVWPGIYWPRGVLADTTNLGPVADDKPRGGLCSLILPTPSAGQ